MMIHAPRPGKKVEEVSMYYWITPNYFARPYCLPPRVRPGPTTDLLRSALRGASQSVVGTWPIAGRARSRSQ